MAASEWEQLTRARGRQRLKIMARHIIRHPVLIAALVGWAVLVNLVKDSPLAPLAFGLAAPVGGVLIAASMGRYRAPAEDPAHEDASLPADTDGK
ncbi:MULTISPECIES: hypothetical protein [unclassified Streptomyces]|uniref:hypothetical protein n=1 Tax=unclassified Streptomyces TaxID=2593676 RepID=UPI000C27EB6B|nr:hypothetical protein [Streptomyces sp. CB01373]PJM96960.1 hypothetical protein CG719_02580 [Streptomyces sp. CB01373]